MAATPICQRTTSNSNKAAASAPSSNSAAKQSVDSSKTLSNGHATETTPLVETKSGQVVDEDALHHEYEFGGPVGVTAMMLGFPALFYYLYVCLFFYDGQLARPVDVLSLTGAGGWIEFVRTIASFVVNNAAPTYKATALYFSLIALQLVLAFTMPGVQQQGLPVASLGGKTLTYNCNALSSFYATVVIVGTAHFTGLFNLADIIDLYGPLLTVASMTGFILAAAVYATGERYRMSGSLIYDYFMGSTLNPRIGSVDIKMWAEIRISWVLLWMLALGGVAKQYEVYGYVSPNIILFAYGSGLYLNACAKGEESIPQTWDMNFEKFGWLLSYWNFAGVPFSYAYPAIYMATHDPAGYHYPTWFTILLFVTLTLAYCVFDMSNGQKSRFKAQQTNTFIPRNAFPQIPGTTIVNPKFITTSRGGQLLLSGWWGVLRKPNYTSDWIQGLCWALSAGFGSPIPYFYPAFHFTMLLHRNARDNARCARKYGEDWKEYQRRVPYTFIPYVY